jgi:flagellar secretion chaperone FliS
MNSTLRNRFVNDGVAAMSNERILVALFDRLLVDIDQAVTAIAGKQVAVAHDKLIHGQRILEELLLALDADVWPGAADLAGLYVHARQLLVTANLRKDPAPLAECRELLAPLAEAWKDAYAQITSAAVQTAATAAAQPVAAGAGTRSWGA